MIVTPGRRGVSRGTDGRFVYEDTDIWNARRTEDGCTYLVRDVYFEPALGHAHGRAAHDVVGKWRMGRPALVEIHRMNFLPAGPTADRAIDELGNLIERILQLRPDVRFCQVADTELLLPERSQNLDPRRVREGLEKLRHILRLLGGEEQLGGVVDTLLVEDEDLAGAGQVLFDVGRRIHHIRKNIEMTWPVKYPTG